MTKANVRNMNVVEVEEFVPHSDIEPDFSWIWFSIIVFFFILLFFIIFSSGGSRTYGPGYNGGGYYTGSSSSSNTTIVNNSGSGYGRSGYNGGGYTRTVYRRKENDKIFFQYFLYLE